MAEKIAKRAAQVLLVVAVSLVLFLVGKHYIDKNMGGEEPSLFR